MKKYKLIKKYPGSPKSLGITHQFYQLNEKGCTSEEWMGEKYYSNHPEFWEEVIEKDYEILSWICTNPNSNYNILNSIATKTDDGTQWLIETTRCASRVRTSCLDDYAIHSVKRLNDGEIFTIGDEIIHKVRNSKPIGKLTNLWISYEQLRGDINNLGVVLCNDIDKRNDIIVYKKPLFTTEDGIDIFKGDKFYIVIIPNKWQALERIGGDGLDFKEEAIRKRCFSTKKAAEDYIFFNKPCISINEFLKTLDFKYDKTEF